MPLHDSHLRMSATDATLGDVPMELIQSLRARAGAPHPAEVDRGLTDVEQIHAILTILAAEVSLLRRDLAQRHTFWQDVRNVWAWMVQRFRRR